MNEVFGFDAYAPKEIAEKIETIGVTKARLPVLSIRGLAANAAPYIQPDTQVVIYDATLESLPFYLKINRPIWSVSSGAGEKASVFGSQ